MNSPATSTTERIVGYDAREYWMTLDDGWTDQRKQGFLYRLDIVKPLSADTRVWPSIFKAEERPSPSNHVGFQSSWADLFHLRNEVTDAFRIKPMRAWRMIAITLMLGEYSHADRVPWNVRLPPVNPDHRDATWTLLGYDVCDQWLLSALSNCGFLPGLDDVVSLRLKWGPMLNEYHLFRELEEAIEFKRFSDERLRDDHAPCFVFGIWVVR